MEFIQQKKDIILIGNPGVGKSFLAKCIAYAATQASVKVLFTTAMDMINHLIAAEADHSLFKNSTIINHRRSLQLTRLDIFRLEHRDQIYSSRSSAQGMKKAPPS
jgi:DNA replication protein DnaC